MKLLPLFCIGLCAFAFGTLGQHYGLGFGQIMALALIAILAGCMAAIWARVP